jgi:4a-hydroxytetrahydrobiopterin dehydratase
MNLAELDCRNEPPATTPLNPAESRALCDALDGWAIEGAALVKRQRLDSFMAAMAFAQKVAVMAQEQDHHPDLHIQGSVCAVLWTTHDAGGLTRRDFIAAARTDALR